MAQFWNSLGSIQLQELKVKLLRTNDTPNIEYKRSGTNNIRFIVFKANLISSKSTVALKQGTAEIDRQGKLRLTPLKYVYSYKRMDKTNSPL